jgi:hypothetical protein
MWTRLGATAEQAVDTRDEMMKLADGRGVEYLTVRQGNTILKFK